MRRLLVESGPFERAGPVIPGARCGEERMGSPLVGLWSVQGVDMIPDCVASLIGGLPGQLVEFTADGRYIVWGEPTDPDPTVSRYCCHATDPAGLDVWIPGLESLVRKCVYRHDGAEARLCI